MDNVPLQLLTQQYSEAVRDGFGGKSTDRSARKQIVHVGIQVMLYELFQAQNSSAIGHVHPNGHSSRRRVAE
jgi:hypothetical protein